MARICIKLDVGFALGILRTLSL